MARARGAEKAAAKAAKHAKAEQEAEQSAVQQAAQRAATHMAEMVKLAKERMQDIRKRVNRSCVYCNCKRQMPPAEHKDNCRIWSTYTGRSLWPGP